MKASVLSSLPLLKSRGLGAVAVFTAEGLAPMGLVVVTLNMRIAECLSFCNCSLQYIPHTPGRSLWASTAGGSYSVVA